LRGSVLGDRGNLNLEERDCFGKLRLAMTFITNQMIIWRRKLYRTGMGTLFAFIAYFGGTARVLFVLGLFLALLILFEYERRIYPGLYGWITGHSRGILKNYTGFFLPETYFVLSVFLVFYFLPAAIGLTALLFLTYGDALSTIIGVKFGRWIIFRQKSFEGFLAFLSGAFVIAFLVSILPRYHLPCAVGFSGALIAGLTELFSVPPDDNFSVTIFSGLAMFLISCFV
jgi:dolichol kinase